MKRRTFIKTTGALGLSSALAWTGESAQSSELRDFPRDRTSGRMLYPRPADGANVSISPVGLAWVPHPDAAGYRVEISNANGRVVYDKEVGADPVHLPNQVLPAGTYTWDVAALDSRGAVLAQRGRQSFTIDNGAAKLPWVEPRELLQRVPRERPRILFPAANLAEIRKSLKTTRANAWNSCRRAADRALTKGIPEFPKYHRIEDPVVRRLEYQKYFGYFRGYVDGALMDLALGFLISEEAKYADAAKEILLEVASWPTDDKDVTSVSARWGDEAGLSFSKCAHVAYDWLHPALDDREKSLVAKMCVARAGQTYRRLVRHNYLTYPGESHDGRLIAYLTDMSLSLCDETPDAAVWLDYSLKALLTFYPHWGGSHGGWAEGVPYGLWYNGFYIPAFEGLRQLAGYDLWQRPFFNNIRYFFFYCTANHGEIRPFGDSAEGGGPGAKRGSGYADLMQFHAHRFQDPAAGWWVKQIPGFEVGQGGRLALLHGDAVPAELPRDLPNSRVFEGVGWAGLHSDLTRPADDTCLIFKSSPYGSVSHSHADQNAFAIMKGGTALAIPSGYYGPSYGKPHHAQWTRSTKANNCILVNGDGQKTRSAAAQGRITAFQDKPGYTYLAGDATEAYMGKLTKWVRHIQFLRPGLFLLLDEIEAPEPSRFQWMLHAFNQMEIGDNQIISQRKDAKLDVHLACALGLTLSQTDQFDTPYNYGIPASYHRQKANHWHVTAETNKNAKSTRIAAVMAVTNSRESFNLELQSMPGWLGVEARGDFGEVTGWMCIGESDKKPREVPNDQLKLWCRDRDGTTFGV